MSARELCRGWFFAGTPSEATLRPTHCRNWAVAAIYIAPKLSPLAHVCGVHRNAMKRRLGRWPGMVEIVDYELAG